MLREEIYQPEELRYLALLARQFLPSVQADR